LVSGVQDIGSATNIDLQACIGNIEQESAFTISNKSEKKMLQLNTTISVLIAGIQHMIIGQMHPYPHGIKEATK